MNYAWSAEHLLGQVFTTMDPVDDEFVFATFTGARKALVDYFDQLARDARESAAAVRAFRKASPEDWSV